MKFLKHIFLIVGLHCLGFACAMEDGSAKKTSVDFSCTWCKSMISKKLRCGKCNIAYYCSIDCQEKDWSRHKKHCNKRKPISRQIFINFIEKNEGELINIFKKDTKFAHSPIDSDESYSLHYAIKHKCYKLVKTLIDLKVNVNCVDRQGFTPLLYAANIGDLKSVQILVNHNADLTIKNGCLGVMYYAISSKNDDLVSFLKKKGAFISLIEEDQLRYEQNGISDEKEQFPELYVAIANGEINEVKRLLAKFELDINSTHISPRLNGMTIFMYAAAKCDYSFVCELLKIPELDVNKELIWEEDGSDKKKQIYHCNALSFAVAEIPKYHEDKAAVIELLLKSKVKYYDSILLALVMSGDTDIINLFIKYCAEDIKKSIEVNPLLGNLLSKHGVDFDKLDSHHTQKKVFLIHACSLCKKSDVSLKICGACKQVWYCSRECQKRDWAAHKAVCKK